MSRVGVVVGTCPSGFVAIKFQSPGAAFVTFKLQVMVVPLVIVSGYACGVGESEFIQIISVPDLLSFTCVPFPRVVKFVPVMVNATEFCVLMTGDGMVENEPIVGFGR